MSDTNQVYWLNPRVWHRVEPDPVAEFQFNTALEPGTFDVGCIALSKLLEIHSFLLYHANGWTVIHLGCSNWSNRNIILGHRLWFASAMLCAPIWILIPLLKQWVHKRHFRIHQISGPINGMCYIARGLFPFTTLRKKREPKCTPSISHYRIQSSNNCGKITNPILKH